MIVLVDNYDSFSYNLYQMLGALLEGKEEIKVIRNDQYRVEEIREMKPSRIIISPGPGKPSEAGIIEELVKECNGEIPILGVCLGHQAICEAFGATVTYAKQLMHGKQSQMKILKDCPLFQGLEDTTLAVARYHSLAAKQDTLPDNLLVVGQTEGGEVMAVMEKNQKTFGLQFHPESILTPKGNLLLQNFLTL